MDVASRTGTLRIILLGREGTGKSSLGNALLKKKTFGVACGLNLGTERCALEKVVDGGLTIEVVDTSGLCDTHKTPSEMYKEVGKSFALTGEGPHVLVFALKCRRFTKEDRQAYQTLKAMFSEEMNNHLIWVFNGLDNLTDEDEPAGSMDTIRKQRQILDEQIHELGRRGGTDADLKKLIDAASGGYFGMNNKASKEVKDIQAQDLLKKMLELKAKNGGKCYTTTVVTDINKIFQKLVTERMTEKGIPRKEAEDEIKREIVEEKVIDKSSCSVM